MTGSNNFYLFIVKYIVTKIVRQDFNDKGVV